MRDTATPDTAQYARYAAIVYEIMPPNIQQASSVCYFCARDQTGSIPNKHKRIRWVTPLCLVSVYSSLPSLLALRRGGGGIGGPGWEGEILQKVLVQFINITMCSPTTWFWKYVYKTYRDYVYAQKRPEFCKCVCLAVWKYPVKLYVCVKKKTENILKRVFFFFCLYDIM